MTGNVYAPPRANLETQEGPQELWQLDFKQVKRLYLASVNIRAFGVLSGIGVVFILAALLQMLLVAPSQETATMAGLMALASVIPLTVCVTAFTRPRWGRFFGIIASVLTMLNFPLGTLIGILMVIAYVHAKRLFGADRLAHKDVAAVYKQRKKTKT